jgi:phospholipid/cholesterol/gamma-HCH transport system substrate-binding protein
LKHDSINYVLVGAVVVAALALLLVGLALITGRSGASSDYVVRYHDVTGLRDGAPVFYQGYRIGQVVRVTPERSAGVTRYKVTLAVRHDWPIPQDSPARLQSSGLLADVSIGISEGVSRQMLAPGGELKGIEGANIFDAMNELAGQVNGLVRTQVAPLIQLLSQRFDSITGTIDKTTPAVMQQTLALLERMNRAADALNDVLNPKNRAAIAGTLADVRNLSAQLRKTRATLDQALGDLAGIARDNRPDLRRSVQDLSHVLQALSSRMDVITHHLESSSRNLDEFSREIRRSPNRLILSPKADKLEVEPK